VKERFEGTGRPNLIDALKRHEMVNGLTPLAEALANAGKIEEFAPGQALIAEGGSDNDIYFLVAGLAAVLVRKNNIATRKAGQTVGEMAAIEPAQPRAATVQALDTVVSVKVTNPDFHRIAGDYPVDWQPMAREFARRLYKRNKLIEEPNESPRRSSSRLLKHWTLHARSRRVWSVMYFPKSGMRASFLPEAMHSRRSKKPLTVPILPLL
jgi:CRP/FNR family transcriptional regulator, cyclic AMP receptor protein